MMRTVLKAGTGFLRVQGVSRQGKLWVGGCHNKPDQSCLARNGRESSLSLKMELAGTACGVRTCRG